MASSIPSSEWEALQKSFKDNVVALRDVIREAAWENNTLINTTQQRLKFTKKQLNAIAPAVVCWGQRLHPTSAIFDKWTEQKLIRALRSMMAEFSGHDPWSPKKPVVERRSAAPTYLGIIDTSREPAAWLMDSENTSAYLANAADEPVPQDGGVHAGQKNVFGKVIVPWDPQTGFPEIQFCDEDGEDNERELAGLKLLQCPTRSRRYLKMCQKADEKEYEYAQELNTATL